MDKSRRVKLIVYESSVAIVPFDMTEEEFNNKLRELKTTKHGTIIVERGLVGHNEYAFMVRAQTTGHAKKKTVTRLLEEGVIWLCGMLSAPLDVKQLVQDLSR